MNKAKFITSLKNAHQLDRHAWEHTDLVYEYRGHQYIVTKHNNGYAFESLRKQHREAQQAIDEKISKQNQPISKWTYEGSAEEGLDAFWEYVEVNE